MRPASPSKRFVNFLRSQSRTNVTAVEHGGTTVRQPQTNATAHVILEERAIEHPTGMQAPSREISRAEQRPGERVEPAIALRAEQRTTRRERGRGGQERRAVGRGGALSLCLCSLALASSSPPRRRVAASLRGCRVVVVVIVVVVVVIIVVVAALPLASLLSLCTQREPVDPHFQHCLACSTVRSLARLPPLVSTHPPTHTHAHEAMDSPNLPRPQPPVTLPPPLVAIPGLLRSPSGSGSSTPTGGAPLPVALPPPIAHLPPGALPLPSVLPPVMPLPSLGSLGHGLPRPVAPISARDGAPTTPHTPTSPAPAPAPLPAPTPVPVPTPAAPPAEAHVAPASTSVHAPPSHSAAPGSAPTPPPPAAPLPPHHDAPHQQPPMPAPLPTPTQTLAPPVAAVAPTAVHAPVAAAAATPATPPTQDGAPPPLPDRSRGNTVVWGAHAAAAAAAAAAPAPAPGSAAAAALASVISPRDTLAPAPPRRDSSMTHMRKASYDSPRRGSAGASPSNIEAARAASASVGDHDSSDDEDDGTAGAVSSSGGGSFQMVPHTRARSLARSLSRVLLLQELPQRLLTQAARVSSTSFVIQSMLASYPANQGRRSLCEARGAPRRHRTERRRRPDPCLASRRLGASDR